MAKQNKNKNKGIEKNFLAGYGPNNPHPPGGYYYPRDPDTGLSPHQRKANKKKPLPGGYNIKDKT